MTATLQARPGSGAGLDSPDPRLLLDVLETGNTCVVHVAGELDFATSDQLVTASTAGRHPEMLIDLGGVTFLDCSGYRALVAARRIVEGDGRSLTFRGQTGQPERFLDLIAELEQ